MGTDCLNFTFLYCVAIIASLWRRNIVLFRATLNGLVSVRVTHCANECQTSQRVSDPDRNGENFDKSVTVGERGELLSWEQDGKRALTMRERGLESQVMLTLSCVWVITFLIHVTVWANILPGISNLRNFGPIFPSVIKCQCCLKRVPNRELGQKKV